jgi:hypothetical protein
MPVGFPFLSLSKASFPGLLRSVFPPLKHCGRADSRVLCFLSFIPFLSIFSFFRKSSPGSVAEVESHWEVLQSGRLCWTNSHVAPVAVFFSSFCSRWLLPLILFFLGRFLGLWEVESRAEVQYRELNKPEGSSLCFICILLLQLFHLSCKAL